MAKAPRLSPHLTDTLRVGAGFTLASLDRAGSPGLSGDPSGSEAKELLAEQGGTPVDWRLADG